MHGIEKIKKNNKKKKSRQSSCITRCWSTLQSAYMNSYLSQGVGPMLDITPGELISSGVKFHTHKLPELLPITNIQRIIVR